jgi:hypothetical protein
MRSILIRTYNVKEFDNHGMKVLTAISVQGLSPCTAPLQSSMQLCSQNQTGIRTSSNQCRMERKLREHPIGQLYACMVVWRKRSLHMHCTALLLWKWDGFLQYWQMVFPMNLTNIWSLECSIYQGRLLHTSKIYVNLWRIWRTIILASRWSPCYFHYILEEILYECLSLASL